MDVEFLGLDEVLALHSDQIRRYGGHRGIRDLALLQSALAAPETTWDDKFLHTSIAEMAAAYLFHIVRNHPFVDGNKRTGLMAALAFLGLNDLEVVAADDELANLVVGVADGSLSKATVAVFVEEHTRARRPSR